MDLEPVLPPSDRQKAVLTHLLSPAREGREIDETALRAAVCTYVRLLKDANFPPERVLVSVKRLANAGGVPDSNDHRPGLQRDTLMERIVDWCIAEYYRGDG